MLCLWYKRTQNKKIERKLNIFFTYKENLNTLELKSIIKEYDGTVKSIKIKEVQTKQKKQAMVCFSKEREIQKAITEIKLYEGWNAEVYRNMYNKNNNVKISSLSKDNQEQNWNTKRKIEENLGSELEKTKNDTKEIKNVIMKKSKDWLETNENKRNSLVKKVDKGRREENQNKIQKEKLKKTESKKRKNNNKKEVKQNKENTERDGDKDINRNKENR